MTVGLDLIFWIVATVIFGIAEGVTVAVVSIWFVVGSLVAVVLAALGVPVGFQVLAFVAVSAGTLMGFRRFIIKSDKKAELPKADDVVNQSRRKSVRSRSMASFGRRVDSIPTIRLKQESALSCVNARASSASSKNTTSFRCNRYKPLAPSRMRGLFLFLDSPCFGGSWVLRRFLAKSSYERFCTMIC